MTAMTYVPAAIARRHLLVGGMLFGMTALAGGTRAAEPERVVTIGDMSYGRIPSDLKVGDTISFANHDTVPHTVTARDKSFDLRVAPGQSARMTMQKEGIFPFYCIYHAAMRGTLKVAAR